MYDLSAVAIYQYVAHHSLLSTSVDSVGVRAVERGCKNLKTFKKSKF